MDRNSRTKRKQPNRSRELMDHATARALMEVADLWDRVEAEGTSLDGTDWDLERGPEDERLVAGERIRTWEDKVFGGRAVILLRSNGDEVLHFILGRVANRETRGSILASELTAGSDNRLPTAAAVPPGVWRNDRNGWVTEQITALTKDEAIDHLVRAFQKEHPDKSCTRT